MARLGSIVPQKRTNKWHDYLCQRQMNGVHVDSERRGQRDLRMVSFRMALRYTHATMSRSAEQLKIWSSRLDQVTNR
jgi:hypothetical protein